MTTASPAAILQLLTELSRAQALIGRGLDRALAPSKLTPPQLEALRHIEEAGALPLGELASRLGVSPGNVTCIVSNLTRAGLVHRARAKADRRNVHVSLSEAGAALLGLAAPAAARQAEALAAGLTPDEQDILMRLVRKLAASAQARL